MDITLLSEAAQPNGFDLYALVLDGECLVQTFIDGLPDFDQIQLAILFKSINHVGPPKSEDKFRTLGDEIYELKTRNGVRVLGFLGPSSMRKSLILTHGFPKPKKKILEREKRKALDWYGGIDDIRIVEKLRR